MEEKEALVIFRRLCYIGQLKMILKFERKLIVKKLVSFLILSALLLSGCAAKAEPKDPDKLQIVATVFPAYDFARAAAGEYAEVTLLLPPGAESHSYEPTPADILAVRDCDLFLYLGGDSDAWVDTILTSVEPTGHAMRMVDCVELLEEEHVEGMQLEPGHTHEDGEECHDEHHDHDHQEEHEEADTGLGRVTGYDEHVWTSPKNAAAITRSIGAELAELDPNHREQYLAAAESYAGEIEQVDTELTAYFDSLTDRTIVFGDRFPLRYFAEQYELDYFAAFPGCSTQTEPSAATIAFLVDKVEREEIPAVWYIEFSNHLVADSIAEATDTKTAMFHTCHNVSRAEMDSGVTYVSLMEQNLETLRDNLT